MGDMQAEQRQEQWRFIYHQLGLLPHLKFLAITCCGVEKGEESGIAQNYDEIGTWLWIGSMDIVFNGFNNAGDLTQDQD
ncbi:hypothetical protein BGX29_001986 [Mortierella sp. GBA35]|nr:hypothetical protein BGX29_001986 [Mortierella sp. GBA35]